MSSFLETTRFPAQFVPTATANLKAWHRRPLQRFWLAAFLLVCTIVAAAQKTPTLVNDNTAQARSGTWTNLSPQAQTAVRGEAAAAALNAASTTTINSVEHWSGKFTYTATGQIYPYTMIGTHPFNNPISSTVPVVMIPLRFVFDAYLVNGKPLAFDPSAIIPKVKASPIWAQHNYGFGAAQYMDALQRDSFSRTNGYHVLLGTPRMLATHVIHVSSANGTVYQTSKGYVGAVSNTFLLNIISNLPLQLGAKPNEFAMMISSNVYGVNSPNNGYYTYGYHGDTQISSTATSSTIQVWAWSSWIGPGWFNDPNSLDITGLTHEIAEAANDPFLNNNAPTFGYPYNASSCNSLIEVGDIAEGLYNDSAPVTVNSYTYHPANVAMIPWFSRTAATTTTKSYSFPSTSLITTHAQNCQ